MLQNRNKWKDIYLMLSLKLPLVSANTDFVSSQQLEGSNISYALGNRSREGLLKINILKISG